MAENRNQDLNRGDRRDRREDEDLGNRMDRERTINREQEGNRSGGQEPRRQGGGMDQPGGMGRPGGTGGGSMGQGGGFRDDEDFGSDR